MQEFTLSVSRNTLPCHNLQVFPQSHNKIGGPATTEGRGDAETNARHSPRSGNNPPDSPRFRRLESTSHNIYYVNLERGKPTGNPQPGFPGVDPAVSRRITHRASDSKQPSTAVESAANGGGYFVRTAVGMAKSVANGGGLIDRTGERRDDAIPGFSQDRLASST